MTIVIKTINICTILCMTIILTSGFVLYQGGATHPDHPNQCYYNETNQTIAFGASYYPVGESCKKVTCRTDYVLELDNCGRYTVGHGCEEIFGDIKDEFPKCCGSIKCKDKDGKVRVTPIKQ